MDRSTHTTVQRTYVVYTPHPLGRGVWLLRLQENKNNTRDGLFYDLSQLAALNVIKSCLEVTRVPVDPQDDPRLYNMCSQVLRFPPDAISVYRLRFDG
jgi:hypothetical protein